MNDELEVDFELKITKFSNGRVGIDPLGDEDKKPKDLDEIWHTVSTIKRDLEAQHQAAVTQQTIMNVAMQMANGQNQTKSGIVIPENKNIK